MVGSHGVARRVGCAVVAFALAIGLSPAGSIGAFAQEAQMINGEGSSVDAPVATEASGAVGVAAAEAAGAPGASEAADASETVSAADAQGVAAPPALAPQAAAPAPKFTQLAIFDGSPAQGGTQLFDLLAGDQPTLDAGKEYYLAVKVMKGDPTDDTWVALDLPWWVDAVNMVGNAVWNKAGSEIDHTSLDKVVSFKAATGASAARKTSAGRVAYHIRNTAEASVKEAGFQVSFRPVKEYSNGSKANQTWALPANQFAFETGAMNGAVEGAVSQRVATTKVVETGANNFNYYESYFPTVAYDDMQRSARDAWAGYFWEGTVWTKVEFDATYPTGATVGDVTFGGVTAEKGAGRDNGDGSSTIHCVVNQPAGHGRNPAEIGASMSFPNTPAFPNGSEQVMTITSMTSATWGDENGHLREGSTDLRWNILDGAPEITIQPYDAERYDWHGMEGIEHNALLGEADLRARGAKNGIQTESQMISVTYAPNAIVRAVNIPLFDDHADTVTINGTDYRLADVAEVHEVSAGDTNGYATIVNTKLGLGPNDPIKTLVYEVGKMRGGYTSRLNSGDHSDENSLNRLSSYGSVADGKPAVAEYRVYEKGTDPALSSEANKKVASVKGIPVKEKVLVYRQGAIPGKPAITNQRMTAGDETTVNLRLWVPPYPELYGHTSAYDEEPALYLVLQKGFEPVEMVIDGTEVAFEDVTAQASNPPTDGTRILKYQTPAKTHTGYYASDQTYSSFDVSFTMGTDTTMSASTFDLNKMMFVGTGTSSVDGAYQYIASPSQNNNVYGINTGKPLGPLNGEFTVQEYKGIEVSSALRAVRNGSPLDTWTVFRASDPDNTRVALGCDYKAQYKLVVTNLTKENARGGSVFIPVPKAGQDFGAAFNPDGAQAFDMTFTLQGAPADGWTVSYLKMKDGVSYAERTAPADGDYAVVSDPADADMIMLNREGEIPDGAGYEFVFDVVTPDMAKLKLVADDSLVNTWNCATRYTIGTTTVVPPTAHFSASAALHPGTVTGLVYEDLNDNGVQDAGEMPLGGIEVRVEASYLVEKDGDGVNEGGLVPLEQGRAVVTQTGVTAPDGTYSFTFLRGAQMDAAGGNADDARVVVTVTNPFPKTYRFSPTTASGNRPSVVTPVNEQAAAFNETAVALNASHPAGQVDAGLTLVKQHEVVGDIAVAKKGESSFTTEHDAVYRAKAEDKLSFGFAFKTSGIKDQMTDVEKRFYGSAEPPRDSIALSDVTSTFEAQLTFPAGVRPPTDPSAYEFKSLAGTDFSGGAASGMYVVKGAAKAVSQSDGTTRVTVTFELADPTAYVTYAKLHDAVFAEPAYLTLVVSGVDVSAAPIGKNLTVTGTVGGSMGAKASVLGQERDFSFAWEAVQDKDVAEGAIGDGTDAVLDAAAEAIQLTLQIEKADKPVPEDPIPVPDPTPDPDPTPTPAPTPDQTPGRTVVAPVVLPVTGDSPIGPAASLLVLAASAAALAVVRMRRGR